MATQTPKRDNTHGEEDTTPRFAGENLSQGYDDDGLKRNQTSEPGSDEGDAGGSSNSTGGGSSSYSSGRKRSPWSSSSGSSSNTGKGSSDGLSRGDLGEQERSASSGASNSTASNGEKAHFDRTGSGGQFGFRQEKGGRFNFTKGSFVKLTRRRVATIAITGLVGGGGIFGLSIIQGPLNAVHLSQIFQKNNYSNDRSSAARLKGLWRFHKTGDIGETKVRKRGSNTFAKATDKLKGVGVEFERNGLSGHPTKLNIDPSKHPATKGLSSAKQAAALDKLYGVDKGTFKQAGSGGFSADIDPTTRKGVTLASSLTQTSLEALEDGKIATANNARVMKIFFNLPKLFSPISKQSKAAQNKAATKLVNREEKKKADEERRKQLKEPVQQRGAAARAKIKENLTSKKVVFSLVATQALCIVRTVADSAVIANRAEIVLPATIESIDKTAIGAQTQSGLDISMDQLGTVVRGFEDENGKTIYSAKALQATAGKPKPAGEDLADDYKQAFSNKTTAQNIKDSVGSFEVAGVDLSGAACSKLGLAVQTGVGIGALIASVGGTPFTGGASLAAFTAKQGAQAAASFGVIYLLQNQFEKLITDDAVLPATLSGPVGGNLMAYGARESSNIVARSSGGIELDDSETAALETEQRIASQEEFRSKSFASRLFDVKDHRSLASSIIDNTSTSPGQNFATLTRNVLNIGKIIPNIFSMFSPKVSAAEKPYDWGFPRYGISKDILEDPNLESPYANAEVVEGILDRQNTDYIERAKNCFGVSVEQDSDGWNVIAQEDTSPTDDNYVGSNCNDKSDYNWKRMVLFVFDSKLMTSVACYDGDEEACAEIGAGGASDSGSNNTNETPSDKVDVAQIGKNSDKLDCAEGTKDLGVITTKYTGEIKKESGPLKIRLCQVTGIPGNGDNAQGQLISGGATVDARVSGVWAAIAKKAKADGVKLESSSSFRLADSCGGTGDGTGCARPGQSFHQTGLAIDFSDMGGFTPTGSYTSCSGRMKWDSVAWKWMKNNASDYGIKQYSAEAWHWDAAPLANRCGKND